MEQQAQERSARPSTSMMPELPTKTGSDIERRWIAEQRDNLMEELYPNGSPGGAFARTPARDPFMLQASASTEAAPAPTKQPATVARQEVCNLSTMFENVEDDDVGGARPAEAPTPARQILIQEQRRLEAQRQAAAREARKTDAGQGSSSRSQFYWNKRSSTGGFRCS